MYEFLKRFLDSAGGLLIDILAFIVPRVPIPLLSAWLDIMLILFYPVLLLFRKSRKNVLTNLDIVFGDCLSMRQKRALARRVVRNLMNIPVFAVYYAHPRNQSKMLNDVTFVGLENLNKALEGNKGVIGLGAHVGNFILMTMAFARTGLPFVVVTKDPPELSLRTRYRRWKEACGLTWIDANSSAAVTKGILRALKNNQIVHLISDERNRHGIVVPFFGRDALTPAGPAVLSLRTGAPIVPIFIHEHDRFRHTVEIHPPLTVELTGDHQRDIYLLTEKANEAIAGFIRRYPDQWAWLNNRWKL